MLTTASTGASSSSASSSENVTVCARFRPLNRSEEAMGKMCVAFRDGESLDLLTDGETYPFTFSTVFRPETTQASVYEEVGEPIIRDVLGGYNGTIFVYGQTGSGKTYTMMGAESTPTFPPNSARAGSNSFAGASSNAVTFSFDSPLAGIIPRAVFDLFDRIEKADAALEFEIKLFFVEIYMEHVRDLLEPSKINLNVREEPSTNSFYVDGCECPYVSSADEVLDYVELGLRNRTTAATRMNDVSSRSHCLLGITVKSTHSQRGEVKVGKLFLVDLAGTEKVAKTKAEGVQLEEAKLINKSLTTLGLVIKILTEGRSQHIPYRDSKLTKILQDALGGNSRTSLIVCCSPSIFNAQETHSTLRFGARAKHIKNRAVVNKEYSITELKSMLLVAQSELQKLKNGQGLSLANAADMSTVLQLEARIRETEAKYTSILAAREELLKETQESLVVAKETVMTQDALMASLQEEISLWQAEFQTVSGELGLQTRRVDKERQARLSERSLLEKLLESTLKARNDVQAIRSTCAEAIRELQVPSTVDMHVDPNRSVNLTGSDDIGGRQGSLTQLQSSSQKSNDAAGELTVVTQRLHLLEKQYGDLELAWRDLMNENGGLMLEMQLADKKLAIRFDRIENLKAGLKQERQMNKELQDELEAERKAAKEKLIEARNDAEYWRHRYEALHNTLTLSSSASRDNTQKHHYVPPADAKASAGQARDAGQQLAPQHSRVVKHIRGGVKASPSKDEAQPFPSQELSEMI